MDTLSSVIALLNPRNAISAKLVAGGDWCIRFPPVDGVKFTVIAKGHCWLEVDDHAGEIALQAGDFYLLNGVRGYRLRTKKNLPDMSAREIFSHAVDGVAYYGETKEFEALGGAFEFDADHAAILLDILPLVIHVPGSSPQAEIVRLMLKYLMQEIAHPEQGTYLMTEHISHIMFMQALRYYVVSGADGAAGWLSALSDPKIGSALSIIHRESAQRWTVDQLAKVAGMSRSSFAQRFRKLVGHAPLDYLMRWRMRLAAVELRRAGKAVSEISRQIGYESESAFSSSFKRVMGCAPTHYRSKYLREDTSLKTLSAAE